MKTGNKLPFQILPGIFSSIDSYTKHVVHGWINELGAPAWLDGVGEIVGYINPPAHHTFQMVIEKYPSVDAFRTFEWPRASDLDELIIGSRA